MRLGGTILIQTTMKYIAFFVVVVVAYGAHTQGISWKSGKKNIERESEMANDHLMKQYFQAAKHKSSQQQCQHRQDPRKFMEDKHLSTDHEELMKSKP